MIAGDDITRWGLWDCRSCRGQLLARSCCCAVLPQIHYQAAVTMRPLMVTNPLDATVGPFPKQVTVSEWPLVVLLSHCLAPRWALPQVSNCQWAAISGPFGQRLVEWWSSGGEWGKRRIPAFSPGPSNSPGLRPAGDLGGQGRGWVLCPTGLQSPRQGHLLAGPRPWGSNEWTSPSSLPLQPHGIGHLHGSQSVGPGPSPPPFGQPEEPEGQLGPGHLVPCKHGWQFRVWGPGPEGTASWDLPPLSQDWTSEGESCAWGHGPFISEWRISLDGDLQEKGPDHDLTLKTKTVTPKMFANNSHTPLTLTRKELCWELLGSLGILRHEPLSPCGVLNTPFSVPDSNVLVLFGLSVRWHTSWVSVTRLHLRQDKMIRVDKRTWK